jgi:hypothetical protein
MDVLQALKKRKKKLNLSQGESAMHGDVETDWKIRPINQIHVRFVEDLPGTRQI